VSQVYGLTESCGPGCLIVGEDAVNRAGSTGRAFFHTEMRVVEGGGNVRPAKTAKCCFAGAT